MSLPSPATAIEGGKSMAFRTCAGFVAPHHCFGGSAFEPGVDALRLNGDGTAAGTPFTIATGTYAGRLSYNGRIAIASDATRYLVLWVQSNGTFGTFLPRGRETSGTVLFPVAQDARKPSLAFDGRDYVATWSSMLDERIFTARISTSGAVQRASELQAVASRPMIAANASLPPLIGFQSPNPLDGVPRGALLFASEFEPAVLPPPAPLILDGNRDGDAVTVQWQPVPGAFGVSIEVQLPDGFYRAVGVAPGGASSARVPLLGLPATGVRVRAWSSAGDSEPSRTIVLPSKHRAAR